MDYDVEIADDLVRLAKFAIESQTSGSQALLRQLIRKYRPGRPALSEALVQLVRVGTTRGASANTRIDALPVDMDSRMPLLREDPPVGIAGAPILPLRLQSALDQIVAEYANHGQLAQEGLYPTRTALLVGPPGVGKTMSAKWVAGQLGLPLLTLDLSAVMSSYLGRTGANLRRVLDYARGRRAVLLLDELDAVAKRRDDATEIGELKRLVTVLLQEIDSWPEGSLLLAATNHGELLDPAVWRRFEVILEFPLPQQEHISQAIAAQMADSISEELREVLAEIFVGASISDVASQVMRARRAAAVGGAAIDQVLLTTVGSRVHAMPTAERVQVAVRLLATTTLSQRKVHEITGVSRDTLRKHAAK